MLTLEARAGLADSRVLGGSVRLNVLAQTGFLAVGQAIQLARQFVQTPLPRIAEIANGSG